jgi:hypothetical protein
MATTAVVDRFRLDGRTASHRRTLVVDQGLTTS